MDPIVSAVVADHAEHLAALLYHPGFPDPGDPFYQHNPAPMQARGDYYDVLATPWILYDGVSQVHYPWDYANITAYYEARLGESTPVTLSIAGSYDAQAMTANITVTPASESALPAGDYRLRIALTESDIHFDGTGNHDIHDHTVRAMFPDAAGTPISFDGRGARSVTTDIVLDPSYVFENCRVVCFVQDDAGGEVWQAATLLLSDLPPATAAATSSWSRIKARFGESP